MFLAKAGNHIVVGMLIGEMPRCYEWLSTDYFSVPISEPCADNFMFLSDRL